MGRVSRAGILLCCSRGWENRGDEAVWVDVVVVGWMVLLRNSGIDRGQGTGFWGYHLFIYLSLPFGIIEFAVYVIKYNEAS